MNIDVVKLSEPYFRGMHAVLDTVAKEKKYLVFTSAPSFEDSMNFLQTNLKRDAVAFVALSESEVIGWCDILPTHGQARAHIGVLGIGLLKEFRGQGLGKTLMVTALTEAKKKGLHRIELSVRMDNLNAVSLYKSLGFVEEGVNEQALLIDGVFHDTLSMALVEQQDI